MYYHLKLTFQKGNISQDTSLTSDNLLSIAKFFDRHDRNDYHVTNWTVYEYNKPTFVIDDLVSECGSNHPINASAIFWDIYDENGCL